MRKSYACDGTDSAGFKILTTGSVRIPGGGGEGGGGEGGQGGAGGTIVLTYSGENNRNSSLSRL